MPSAVSIRAFIAIELPPEAKQALNTTINRLRRPGDRQVKWVAPESIHITLKFLGNIRPDQVDPITEAMRTAANGVKPFKLGLGKPGAFPNQNQVQVAWIGLAGDLNTLGELQKQVESGLASLGFAPENRPFQAHLTLARLRDHATPAERAEMGQRLTATPPAPAAGFKVHQISLMQSRLTPQGARYSKLAAVTLNPL